MSDNIPTSTIDEINSLNSYWVIKAWKNKEGIQRQIDYIVKDKSIGIHFGNHGPFPTNVTDIQIVEKQPETKKPSRKMIQEFCNDIKIGDKIIIGKGKTGSLFVAEIASTYYYQPSDNIDDCQHRRRIKNIRRVPEEFIRQSQIKTLKHFTN